MKKNRTQLIEFSLSEFILENFQAPTKKFFSSWLLVMQAVVQLTKWEPTLWAQYSLAIYQK